MTILTTGTTDLAMVYKIHAEMIGAARKIVTTLPGLDVTFTFWQARDGAAHAVQTEDHNDMQSTGRNEHMFMPKGFLNIPKPHKKKGAKKNPRSKIHQHCPKWSGENKDVGWNGSKRGDKENGETATCNG